MFGSLPPMGGMPQSMKPQTMGGIANLTLPPMAGMPKPPQAMGGFGQMGQMSPAARAVMGARGTMPPQAQGNAYGRMGMRPPNAPPMMAPQAPMGSAPPEGAYQQFLAQMGGQMGNAPQTAPSFLGQMSGSMPAGTAPTQTSMMQGMAQAAPQMLPPMGMAQGGQVGQSFDDYLMRLRGMR